VLTGGGGSNVFVADGGFGADTMNGGSGSNLYYIDGNSTVQGAGTFNTVIELQQNVSLTLGSAQLGTDVKEVVLNGGTNTVDFHTATSSVYLYGGAGNDTLFGGTGTRLTSPHSPPRACISSPTSRKSSSMGPTSSPAAIPAPTASHSTASTAH
jgi:hypothetical protein